MSFTRPAAPTVAQDGLVRQRAVSPTDGEASRDSRVGRHARLEASFMARHMDHANSACKQRLRDRRQEHSAWPFCVSACCRNVWPLGRRDAPDPHAARRLGRRGVLGGPLGKLAQHDRERHHGHVQRPLGRELAHGLSVQRVLHVQHHRHAVLSSVQTLPAGAPLVSVVCTVVVRASTAVVIHLREHGAIGRVDGAQARRERPEQLAGAVVVVVCRQAERQANQVADGLSYRVRDRLISCGRQVSERLCARRVARPPRCPTETPTMPCTASLHRPSMATHRTSGRSSLANDRKSRIMGASFSAPGSSD